MQNTEIAISCDILKKVFWADTSQLQAERSINLNYLSLFEDEFLNW